MLGTSIDACTTRRLRSLLKKVYLFRVCSGTHNLHEEQTVSIRSNRAKSGRTWPWNFTVVLRAVTGVVLERPIRALLALNTVGRLTLTLIILSLGALFCAGVMNGSRLRTSRPSLLSRFGYLEALSNPDILHAGVTTAPKPECNITWVTITQYNS